MGLMQVTLGVVASLPEILGSLIEGVVNTLAGIWDGLGDAFGNLGDWFGGKFGEAVEAIQEAFSGVGEWFAGIWNNIKNAFAKVGSWFSDIFKKAWEGIKKAFGKVGEFFGGIWNTIKKQFSEIGQKVGKAVSDAFKKAINWVLEKAIGIINGFIKTINGAIKIINKIPGVNIKELKLLDVPKLARGGVVDSATLAMIGERGKEAVVPLENNTEWMDKLAEKLGNNNNTPSKIVLMLDGKELGYATINSINSITRQTGSLQLALI